MFDCTKRGYKNVDNSHQENQTDTQMINEMKSNQKMGLDTFCWLMLAIFFFLIIAGNIRFVLDVRADN